MSKRMIAAVAATAVAAVAAGMPMTQAALAQEIKVGVILPYTGVGAELAQQIERGAQLYLKLNPDQAKPYTFNMIKRDSKAPNGAEAKIAAQELLTQDKVDVLAGWVYSPDAIASAPVVNAGKKLSVIMNAGTSFITNLSPYYVRTSFTLWHSSYALGEAAAKTLKAKTAVVAYSDYPPGKDSLDGFKTAFEANGGRVLDAIPSGGPGQVPDFTPFFQRAKDEKPDVLFVFVPAGDHATAVVKTYGALGMAGAGIKLIGPGDIVQDIKLQGMGDAAVGLITMHHYNADLDNPQNKKFVAAWKKDYGADFDARLHLRRRLRRHGGHCACRAGHQRQDGRRRRGQIAARLEVRQPAGPDHDRSGNPRHRHERISVRSGERAGRQAARKTARRGPERQGPVQGAGVRPVRAEEVS